MKVALAVARILVGVLFIFSGLIKANDPLGLSYKMQEFFDVWGWHGWTEYTLALSVVLIAFEIIAGVAVLLGWQFKIFSWLLLLLIICFSFLTGYAVLSGKIKECGCFGDCIKLTAMDSFIKDLVLLALILFLVVFQKRVRPSNTFYCNDCGNAAHRSFKRSYCRNDRGCILYHQIQRQILHHLQRHPR